MKRETSRTIRRERIIMAATSAFVLGALTLTGVYMRNQNRSIQNDGYTIDFGALENSADHKLREIAENEGRGLWGYSDMTEGMRQAERGDIGLEGYPKADAGDIGLDVYPKADAGDIGLEVYPKADAGDNGLTVLPKADGVQNGHEVYPQAGNVDPKGNTGLKDNSGHAADESGSLVGSTGAGGNGPVGTLTDRKSDNSQSESRTESENKQDNGSRTDSGSNRTGYDRADLSGAQDVANAQNENQMADSDILEASGAGEAAVSPAAAMHFAADRMVRPVSGEILIGYSMESSVYFATLDQYKHHPGIVYKAMEGESVNACNAGRVIDIREDAQHGQMLELDLGDGIHAIYGQLGEIEVPVGAEVAPGMKIAGVAKPTKYFSVEGTNLYFELTQDGKSIDPGNFFGEGDL